MNKKLKLALIKIINANSQLFYLYRLFLETNTIDESTQLLLEQLRNEYGITYNYDYEQWELHPDYDISKIDLKIDLKTFSN